MSLILEALKKSEAERRAGEVPGLLSERTWTPRRERPMWPVFAVFVVMVGLAAGFANRKVLWPERFGVEPEQGLAAGQSLGEPEGRLVISGDSNPGDSDDATSDTTAVLAGSGAAAITSARKPERLAQPETVAAPAAAASTASAPAPATAGSEPVTVAAAQADPVPSESVPSEPTSPSTALAGNDPPPTFSTPPAGYVPPPDLTTPSGLPPSDAPPSDPAPRVDTAPATEVTAAPGVVTRAPAEPPPAEPTVPLFSDLPFATRQTMPAIKLSMHFFHQDPARRFIIVNGARLQEGGVVGEETWLREIGPAGAVFEFRGERFLIPRQGR